MPPPAGQLNPSGCDYPHRRAVGKGRGFKNLENSSISANLLFKAGKSHVNPNTFIYGYYLDLLKLLQ